MKFSYKGGDNGRNIENPLIFKRFQSCVTTVRMQLNSRFLVEIFPEHYTSNRKKEQVLNYSQMTNIRPTPNTINSIVGFWLLIGQNPSPIGRKNEFSWGLLHLGYAQQKSLKGFWLKKSKFTSLICHNIVNKPTQHFLG